MPAVVIRCPNEECHRRLQVKIKPNTDQLKCRCPACRSAIALALERTTHPPSSVDEDDDDVQGYGIAQESSLTYLLRREQDGHKLTRDEKLAKKRLIAEKLADHPDHCPACDRAFGTPGVCFGCGFDLRTGRRPHATVETISLQEESNRDLAEIGTGFLTIIATIVENA